MNTLCYMSGIYEYAKQVEVRSNVGASTINNLYEATAYALNACAINYVPATTTNFYNSWWDGDLQDLKEQELSSC